MSKPIHVTDDTFDAEVKQSTIPVVVDFWAKWCGPCHMIAPMLDEIAGEYDGKLKVVKVDVDISSSTAVSYSIMSIPSLLFFKDGKVVEQVVGAIPKAELVSRIQKMLV
jgi:thioredoxin 1